MLNEPNLGTYPRLSGGLAGSRGRSSRSDRPPVLLIVMMVGMSIASGGGRRNCVVHLWWWRGGRGSGSCGIGIGLVLLLLFFFLLQDTSIRGTKFDIGHVLVDYNVPLLVVLVCFYIHYK